MTKKLLSDIDREFPDGIVLDGIDISLGIKTKILQFSNGQDFQNLDGVKKKEELNLVKKALSYFLLPYCRYLFRANIGTCKVLFFTTGIEYIGQENAFFDPIKKLFGKKYDWVDVDISKPRESAQGIGANKQKVTSFYFLFKILGYLYVDQSSKYLSDKKIQKLFEIFTKNNFHDVGIVYSALEDLYFIRHYSDYMDKILRKFAPEKIILVCYYGLMQSSLIAAAKKHKIPTIELQHSIMTENYNYYNESLIYSDINIAPNYYWCWSKYYFEVMSKYRIYKNLLIGGNLWLQGLRKKAQVKNSPLRVLFCTSTYDGSPSYLDWLGEILIEAIHGLESVDWVIRLHPSINPVLESEIRNYFSQLRNVNVIHAREISFYDHVQTVDYHITYKSTTAIEAEYFGVQNIIVGDLQENYYRNDVEDGRYLHASSSKELVDILKSNIVTKINNNKYIDAINCVELLRAIKDIR